MAVFKGLQGVLEVSTPLPRRAAVPPTDPARGPINPMDGGGAGGDDVGVEHHVGEPAHAGAL